MIETELAGILAEVAQIDRVDSADHFFEDLGADSMTLARFCARLRKRPDLPSPSIRDVYDHPTLAALASALVPLGEPTAAPADDPGALTAPAADASTVTPGAAPSSLRRAGSLAYVLCGIAQLLAFVGYAYGFALASTLAYEYVVLAPTPWGMYVRAVAAGAVIFAGMCLLPIAAKWLLVGRWKPTEIRIWSIGYLRFWLVRTLVRANPLLLVAGGRSHTSGSSPWIVLYLRALGAKVGPGVAVHTRDFPVCTDLITLGAGAVVRKDVQFPGYHAVGGVLRTGRITLGRGALVGEACVLDIDTAVGEHAQVGHASALLPGQSVPAGERWHGVPAEPGGPDLFAVAGHARCGRVRRAWHAVGQLVLTIAVIMPLGVAVASIILDDLPRSHFLEIETLAFTTWLYFAEAAALSAVLFGVLVLLGLVFVRVVPRILNLFLRADRDYPLYGFHYGVHRLIGRFTNVKFFTTLFGDSSYIVGYLRWIGYDLDAAEQTGSNFGTEVRHETPFHVTVGRGTMVADQLSVIDADFSATSFRISRVTIGAHSFLGNRIAYPAQSRAGENILLATKVLVPMDGEIRQDTGLLGSPSFRIPRTVERDTRFDHLRERAELRRRLSRKNHYNLRTMAVFLTVRWVYVFGITLLALAVADLYRGLGPVAVAGELVVSLLFSLVYFGLVERAAAGFRPLRPRLCSIYDPAFWRHERYWKLALPAIDRMLAGTPWKNLLSRALGVRIGRRVFDDGCAMPERTLVAVGDDATLNANSAVQCHSQEDGTFKSDRSALGARVTLGLGAFVHYGVLVDDGAELAAGSFLMKGEEVPPDARWVGNPAHEQRSSR